MKKLIGMTDFVLEIDNDELSEAKIESIFKYAKFLKQPLELWMFVATDQDGNVLEIPNSNNEKYNKYGINQNVFYEEIYYQDLEEYKKSKERCLFEGFEIYDEDTLRFDDIFLEYSDFFKIDVEGLEYYCSSTKLQLSSTAIKQLGI